MKDEKIFRDKLHHHTIPVKDGLWDRIESQLPPKRDNRALPVFWFTLFATTLLSGTLMIGMVNNKTSQPAITPVPEPLSTTTSQTELASVDNQSTAEDGNASGNLSQDSKNDSPAHDNSNSIASGSMNTTSTTKNTDTNANTNTNTIPTSNKRKPSNSTTANASPGAAKSNTEFLIHSNPTVEHTSSISSAEKQTVGSSTLFTPVSFLPMTDLNLNDEESLLLSIESLKPDPNCYKFGSVGSDYALSADILAGPGFSPKSYEENGGEPGYADARRKTEHNQYAWSVGGRINVHHRSGLTARLGLTYTQAGDLFDYTDSLATQSTTRIDSFFAADGTFLYTESSQVLILGTLIKKIHNTYRYLDIPLLVGYELPLGRSLMMVNVGPVLNLISSHEGQILDPMFHPRSITKGDPGAIDVYKTSLGLSIYVGAGVVIPISDRISGLVEPSFLYRLKPVTLGSYPLSEHRHYAGLNLGIRYHFN